MTTTNTKYILVHFIHRMSICEIHSNTLNHQTRTGRNTVKVGLVLGLSDCSQALFSQDAATKCTNPPSLALRTQ